MSVAGPVAKPIFYWKNNQYWMIISKYNQMKFNYIINETFRFLKNKGIAHI